MSKFITNIPVEIDALKQGVPKNTFIESVRLSDDKRSVEVVWDNPAFQSPVQGAWPFPIDDIRNGTLPDRVTIAEWVTKKSATLTPEAEKEVAVPVGQHPESETGVGNNPVVSKEVKRKK